MNDKPRFLFRARDERFNPILIFFYSAPAPKYIALFAYAWVKAVTQKTPAWYIKTGIFPEFSLN